MFNWFKKQSPTPNGGPDFSDINSKEKAEARLQTGELEKLFLLPAELGGTDDPRNLVYVPRGFLAIKANIDLNIIKPLVADGKVTLIAGVTSDLTGRIKAGDLVNHVATQVGGKGGGRADMAQAGGTDPAGLPAALASVKSWVEERL